MARPDGGILPLYLLLCPWLHLLLGYTESLRRCNLGARWFWLGHLGMGCATIASAGCGYEVPTGASTEELVPFHVAFELTDSVVLRASTDDPVAEASKIVTWGDGLALVDGMQGNVKTFDRDGVLIRTVGRPGDGPGEFRRPVDAVVLEDGALVVLDARHQRLSRFDATGTHERDMAVGGHFVSDVERIEGADGDELLAVAYQDDVLVTRGEWGNGVHILDQTGRYQNTIARVEEPMPPRSKSFSAVSMAIHGRCVAVARVYSDTVHLYDPWATGCGGSGKLHGAPLVMGGPGYYAPAWPDAGRMLTSADDAMKWSQAQMWLMDVFANWDIVIAELVTTDATERVLYYQYVVADGSGRVRAATEASEQRIVGMEGDTVYTVDLTMEGDAVLRTYRFPVSPLQAAHRPGEGGVAREARDRDALDPF